jgi:hypothetical protein
MSDRSEHPTVQRGKPMFDKARELSQVSNPIGDFAKRALEMHARYRGKIQMQAKVPVGDKLIAVNRINDDT